MTSNLRPDLPLVEVDSRDAWRNWLEGEHGRSSGVWVVTMKKPAAMGAGVPYVSAVDINEECLCFGWIDSKPGRVDDRRTCSALPGSRAVGGRG